MFLTVCLHFSLVCIKMKDILYSLSSLNFSHYQVQLRFVNKRNMCNKIIYETVSCIQHFKNKTNYVVQKLSEISYRLMRTSINDIRTSIIYRNSIQLFHLYDHTNKFANNVQILLNCLLRLIFYTNA